MGIASGPIFPLIAGKSFPSFPPDPTSGQNTEPESDRPGSRPAVLLVEDNPPDAYVIDRVLKRCGVPIDLRVVSDGEQALAIFQQSEADADYSQPSLILLDWNLPGLSGADVLGYVRRSERLRDVPVVIVTSTSSPAEVREMRRLGATAHFRKPTDLEAYLDLNRIVLEILPKPRAS